MCEFCKYLETDYFRDWKLLIDKDINFGDFGFYSFYAVIERNRKSKPCLSIGICSRDTDQEIQKHQKIKYCPMCGRKLE